MSIKKLLLVGLLLQGSYSLAEDIYGDRAPKVVTNRNVEYREFDEGAYHYRVCTHSGTRFAHIMGSGAYSIQNKLTGDRATYGFYGNSNGEIVYRVQGKVRSGLPVYFRMSEQGVKYSYSYDANKVDEIDSGFKFTHSASANGNGRDSVITCTKN